ncbi:MAG TPA: hypothetical protein VE198_04890 [Actinoallomurus sp.]|nr:hypothetical protein [Actinoallomurus sp.]
MTALRDAARPVSDAADLLHVATLAAGSDPVIGEVIAEAIDRVGPTGVITVEESPAFGLDVDFVEGMEFDRGYLSPHMVTEPGRVTAEPENAYLGSGSCCCGWWSRPSSAPPPG